MLGTDVVRHAILRRVRRTTAKGRPNTVGTGSERLSKMWIHDPGQVEILLEMQAAFDQGGSQGSRKSQVIADVVVLDAAGVETARFPLKDSDTLTIERSYDG